MDLFYYFNLYYDIYKLWIAQIYSIKKLICPNRCVKKRIEIFALYHLYSILEMFYYSSIFEEG